MTHYENPKNVFRGPKTSGRDKLVELLKRANHGPKQTGRIFIFYVFLFWPGIALCICGLIVPIIYLDDCERSGFIILGIFVIGAFYCLNYWFNYLGRSSWFERLIDCLRIDRRNIKDWY